MKTKPIDLQLSKTKILNLVQLTERPIEEVIEEALSLYLFCQNAEREGLVVAALHVKKEENGEIFLRNFSKFPPKFLDLN